MFNKQKEEIKTTFSENMKNLIKESKIMLVLGISAGSLIAGFIMGSITTGAIYKTMQSVHK